MVIKDGYVLINDIIKAFYSEKGYTKIAAIINRLPRGTWYSERYGRKIYYYVTGYGMLYFISKSRALRYRDKEMLLHQLKQSELIRDTDKILSKRFLRLWKYFASIYETIDICVPVNRFYIDYLLDNETAVIWDLRSGVKRAAIEKLGYKIITATTIKDAIRGRGCYGT